MTEAIIIYITCNSYKEAQNIGSILMKKRLSPCYNIVPEASSAAFWPPKTGQVEEVKASILLIKTFEGKYYEIEKEVRKVHSDKTPCILSLPIFQISKDYLKWMDSEIKLI
ncbi:divalent-cation tolerance protein CutA [Patescibacteria group bacterium]